MSTTQATTKPRRTRARPELSIFEEELNVAFNQKEFLPDLPPHARGEVGPPNSTDSAQKVEPKLSQSEAKVEPELRPKLSQSEAKVEPPSTFESNADRKLSRKVEPELRPKVEPNLSQSEAKVEPNPGLLALSGLQFNSMRYIYSLCRMQGSKSSGPVAVSNLAKTLDSTPAAVRKALQRLEKKKFVVRVSYKDGRGGWTNYALPDNYYNALLLDETRAKVEPNLGQTRAKVEPELEPELRPSLSSSSSFLISENLKTTTTGESELFENSQVMLAPEWASVDFSALSEIGFTHSHLVQLAKQGKLSPVEVQDSIHFFAFDLQRNEKGREIKGPSLNFFMGILRKGFPYTPPENYESAEAEARRQYLESKRRLEEQRQAEERELQELEFSEWRRGLTQAQLNEIVPEVVRDIIPARESSLRGHFDKNVWPDRWAKIPGSIEREREVIRQQISESLGEL